MKLYGMGRKKIYIPRGGTRKIYLNTRRMNGTGLLLSYKLGAGFKTIKNESKEIPPDMSGLNDKLSKLNIRTVSKKKKLITGLI